VGEAVRVGDAGIVAVVDGDAPVVSDADADAVIDGVALGVDVLELEQGRNGAARPNTHTLNEPATEPPYCDP